MDVNSDLKYGEAFETRDRTLEILRLRLATMDDKSALTRLAIFSYLPLTTSRMEKNYGKHASCTPLANGSRFCY